jgi:hypothetical protein
MLDDWKAALDAVVRAQGRLHRGSFTRTAGARRSNGSSSSITRSAPTGKRVKFLTFREALERLEKNALGGHPLRAKNGGDNGVRVLDLDADGFMDVVIGATDKRVTRRGVRMNSAGRKGSDAVPARDAGQGRWPGG